MTLQCNACGKRFRSMASEAKHRHNFPAYCDKSSREWLKFENDALRDRLKQACERIADMIRQDDGEAFFQAERFLKANAPDLYEKIGMPQHVTGNAELDAGATNHFDPSKRGFDPK